jgi:hypothetical protein
MRRVRTLQGTVRSPDPRISEDRVGRSRVVQAAIADHRRRRAASGRRIHRDHNVAPRGYAAPVSISDKTRKTLWVKAGGRCSICRQQVVTDAEAAEDDPSVYGEECHIVARSPGGPRAGEIENPDGYHNLILLCRKHHKQVDDQPAHFTVERLHQIKCDHEAREAARSGPVRLIADPARPAPKVLTACFSGDALWSHLRGSYSFYPSWPDDLDDAQGEAVATLLDYLRDWLDVASEMSHADAHEAAKEAGEHIRELLGLGIVTGVRPRYLLLADGVDAEPSPWRSFDIQFHRVSEAQRANEDGTPYRAGATAH